MEVAGDPAAAKLRLYEALVAEEGAPRGEPDVRWAKYWEVTPAGAAWQAGVMGKNGVQWINQSPPLSPLQALGAFLHGGLTKFELEAVVRWPSPPCLHLHSAAPL